MKISAEFLLFCISCAFALGGIFNYFMGEIWPLLWIASFVSLLGSVGVDIVDRFGIEVSDEQ